MKSKLFFLFFLIVLTIPSNAQVKIYPDGHIDIFAQINSWEKGIQTIVNNPYACAYNLNLNGTDVSFFSAQGYLWTQTGGYFGSDKYLKQNITPIREPLKFLKSIQGYRFEFKTEPDRIRYGLIGQDVFEYHPELVRIMKDSTYAVAYMDLIAVLIECVKEQQLQIEQLRTKVEGLLNDRK